MENLKKAVDSPMIIALKNVSGYGSRNASKIKVQPNNTGEVPIKMNDNKIEVANGNEIRTALEKLNNVSGYRSNYASMQKSNIAATRMRAAFDGIKNSADLKTAATDSIMKNKMLVKILFSIIFLFNFVLYATPR